MLMPHNVFSLKESSILSLEVVILLVVYETIYCSRVLHRITKHASKLSIELIAHISSSRSEVLSLAVLSIALNMLISDHCLLKKMSIVILDHSNELWQFLLEVE
jgi:hypothetical protein